MNLLKTIKVLVIHLLLIKKNISNSYTPAFTIKCLLLFFGTFLSANANAASIPNSVCNAQTPGSAWGDISVRWEHNADGGTSSAGSIDNNGIFQSASNETFSGINAQINDYDLNIDSTTVPSAIDLSKYIQYTVTTGALTVGQAELTGIAFAQFEKGESWHNQSSGTFDVHIAVDDDPAFGSPEVLFNQITVDPVDTSQADVVHGPDNHGTLYYRLPHYDADNALELAANTTYTIRVYPYNVTANGADSGSPYGANVVLWDDIMFKGVTCAAAVDRSDAPLWNYGDATHTIVNDIQLGATITADASAYDDSNAAADIDDGVTLPAFRQGGTVTLQVDVEQVSASSGYLQGWIDWNGDGDFTDSGEQIVTNLQSAIAGSSTIDVEVTVPTDAISSTQTFARFRWSTTSGLDSLAAASDGEVEDYAFTIQPFLATYCKTNTLTKFTFSEIVGDGDSDSEVGEILVYSNVATDVNGNEADLRLEVVSLQGGPAQMTTSGMKLNSTLASDDDFIVLKISAVASGSVTASLPNGIPAEFSNFTFIIKDIDSSSATKDFSDVGGYDTAQGSQPSYLTIFNTALSAFQNGGGPGATFEIYAQNPAKYKDPSNWYDEPNESSFDNYFALNYSLFSEAYIVHGATGSNSSSASTRGASYGACGVYIAPPSDYSDAPTSGVSPDGSGTNAYGDARHIEFAGIRLGAAMDADSVLLGSSNADGDGGDDDGVSIPELFQDAAATIDVTVNQSSVNQGYLQAWIDWNGDGDFSDADEQIATNLQLATGTSGTFGLSVTVPSTAIVNAQTFARFRWSSTAGLNSTEVAFDGEVEDYAVTIKVIQVDWGDAPSDLSTLDASMSNSYGDASHTIDPTVYLGSLVDKDTGSQNGSLLADGDDTDGSDDDDGVIFDLLGGVPTLRTDSTNTYKVEASVNGFLNAWIDWNQDGDWDDSGEQIATNEPLAAGSNNLNVVTEPNIPHGVTYARFRFTSVSVTAPSPIGLLDDGEVEDYAVHLLNPDPIDNCGSMITNGYMEGGPFPGTFTQVAEESIEGWATIPINPASSNSFFRRNQIEVWASGFLGVPAFEGDYFVELNSTVAGMFYQDVALNPGSSYRWKLAHRGRSGTDTMKVLMGAPRAEILQATLSTNNTAWAQYSGTYTVPAGEYITRFGFQSGAGGSYGNFLDAISIPGGCDFGDAPDSYGTLKSSNGAYHMANSLLQLGDLPGDPETTGVPSAGANGDDTDTDADEDGLSRFGTIYSSSTSYSVDVEVSNNTGTNANLGAWIDFDGNGSFDGDEYARALVATGISSGTVTLRWSVIPSDIVAGDTYLRLRVTTDTLNNREPKGEKSNGEVEDYALTIMDSTAVGGRVYIDANSDMINESGEAGIPNTVVVLIDTTSNVCQSTRTSGSGDYRFIAVADGTYQIYQAHGETTPIPQNCDVSLANNPTGYQSTTPDTLSITVAGADITGQDFGEVAGANSTSSGSTGVGISFTPNNQSAILPGNVVFYSHKLRSEADGVVQFTTTGSNNNAAGWSHLIYRDTDCNGTLEGSEADTPIENMSLGIAAGGELCIVDKVYAPNNAAGQESYKVETIATFNYAGGALAPVVLSVVDVTTASEAIVPEVNTSAGVSSLVLRKTVENLTQMTAETETVNQARPNDVLKYRIYYRNPGTAAITDLKVNDSVPAFTSMVPGSESCEETPSGMACVPIHNSAELNWSLSGELEGGVKGCVSYQVVVDQ